MKSRRATCCLAGCITFLTHRFFSIYYCIHYRGSGGDRKNLSGVRFGWVYKVPVMEVGYEHTQEEVRERVMKAERKVGKRCLVAFVCILICTHHISGRYCLHDRWTHADYPEFNRQCTTREL